VKRGKRILLVESVCDHALLPILSYTNEKRLWRLYESVFYQLLGKIRMIALAKKKFFSKNRLVSLDAAVKSISYPSIMAIFLSLLISPMVSL
jgi:hypothetical protein